MKKLQTSEPALIRPKAAIDIGTTFIRLMIAERDDGAGVRILERAVQSAPIGRDIVVSRRVSNATISQCIQILKSFRQMLDEYGIGDDDLTAVATFSLRQAENCEVFLDRLSQVSRMSFVFMDSGRIGYYYHLAFRALQDPRIDWEKSETVLLDIGGLTCGMHYRKAGEIRFVQTFNVGSLILWRQRESAALGPRHYGVLADGRAREIAERIRRNADSVKSVRLLLMGREMRFVAGHLREEEYGAVKPPASDTSRIPVASLQKLLKQVEVSSTEELVRQWRLSYADAELLAPTLSLVIAVAGGLDLKSVYVSGISFSHGLLEEAVAGIPWTRVMRKQVLRMARGTGEKYLYDGHHAAQVARIALAIFDLLQEEHGCTERHRLILEVAALLHDIGVFVSAHSHNKHSMYLIRNTEFAGLSGEEIELIAVVARYHRKSVPRPSHDEYTALSRDNRLVVGKLAAILRTADALDRVHDQSLGKIRFELSETTLTCIPANRVATSAEQVALEEKGDMFEIMFGRKCLLYNSV